MTLHLFDDDARPDLRSFDVILVNTSAGKDSQCMLDVVVEAARAAGVLERCVAVHADLEAMEWPGVPELAQEQAEHYGVRFIRVARPQGNLLDMVNARHDMLRARGDTTTPAWPSSQARYCTSDLKRGQVRKVMTALTTEVRERDGLDRPVRILNCMGFRRQESAARAKKQPYRFDGPASTKTTREVWEWAPILDWTVEQVWARIRQAGTRHHWAYDAGMPRLSCCFCVLAGRDALIRAAQLMPELAQEYLATEVRVGHTFRQDLSMADIVAAANRETVTTVSDWSS